MLYAHITKVRGGYEVRITESNRPIGGYVIGVQNKRDARKIVAEAGAQPWNF